MSAPAKFGPFVDGLDPAERARQFRSLSVLAAAYTGSGSELVRALKDAEKDYAAAPRALELLDRMPALTKRKMLSIFGAVTWGRR
jgi:hypothetical protein